jgi:quercetin dioxygenase-like cupin family protein
MGRMQRTHLTRTPSGWEGVAPEGYVPGDATKVVRHTLVGGRKESPADPGPATEVRYFAVPPGAVTRLEKHEHEHYVIVGEGTAHAIVGDDVREIRTHDVVYVGPWEVHQFVNTGETTFGFFCIVSAHRDISQTLDANELARLKASPAGAYADPDGAPPPRKRETAATRG